MLGGPFLRLGIPIERLSIPPGTGWGGKNAGWLVTWDCPLRTDSASLKSLESFIQLISFCNSCILPVSSRIVSRSSTNFSPRKCLECWALKSLQFFHFTEPNFASITVHEQVDDLVDVVRLLDDHDKFLLFATRSFRSTFEYFFCRNLLGIRVFESLLDSQRESALCRSRRGPNLFAFRVVFLSFLGARDEWANNGSPRSNMTDWRRQTGRQAFFFRVIGSFSARVKERLADGDVIVVEVIEGPLLAGGLLGVLARRRRSCGSLVLGQGAKVLSGSTQGICPPHRGSWRCRAVGTAGWSERWWGRRWSEWRSRRDQEQHSQRENTCACNVGRMRTWALSALSQCSVVNLKEKQSRDADN